MAFEDIKMHCDQGIFSRFMWFLLEDGDEMKQTIKDLFGIKEPTKFEKEKRELVVLTNKYKNDKPLKNKRRM